MYHRFTNSVILITAATWLGFACWLGTQPTALLRAFGVESSTPQMLTEVRAFYGGVELAIAMAMVVLWWRGQPLAALLIGGLPLLGSALGRAIGLIVDGYSATHLSFALLELTGAAFCGVGFFWADKKSSQRS